MPKVISYTPDWLSGNSPGQGIFSPTESQRGSLQALSEAAKRKSRSGPRRVIARRGTEIFVAVGKEIRWGDLVQLKDEFRQGNNVDDEESMHGAGNGESRSKTSYKVFKTPVADDIRQLIMSPNNDFMAILTIHTVHIAILPDSSQLSALFIEDQPNPRLKTYMLGAVIHVTTQSPIASALWHPLGVNGSCIVTVTEDAIVRTWELATSDRGSFDRATLTIDLRKLIDGTALEQDFSASVAANKGFSPDSFEMEVAAAAFTDKDCAGWAPMTLWIAMREGDIYALCPFLPERWAPPPTLIPSLSVAIVARVAELEDNRDADPSTTLLAQQQLAWMADLDNQSPTTLQLLGSDSEIEVFTRPRKPGKVPKLQGPFEFEFAPDPSEDDLDERISDIHVIGAHHNTEDLMYGEEDELDMDGVDEKGLSLGIVCLLRSSGRLSICLDVDGVEAQWLPSSKSKSRSSTNEEESPSLLTFQTMDTLKEAESYDESWPMFSTDVASRYSFFITHASGVTAVSLTPWAFRLESELQESSNAGLEFRIDLIVKSQNSLRQRVITRHLSEGNNPTALSASVAIQDPDLGYLLLSSSPHRAVAVCFEMAEDKSSRRSRSPTYDSTVEPQPLLICAPREVYQGSPIFTMHSALPRLLEDLHRSRYKRMMSESIRLSPATLTIMTNAHKVLSEESHRISSAAAELFRRCERLQIELKDQISRANDVASRVESVVGDDLDAEDNNSAGNEALEARIQHANQRQQSLTERLEKIRKKALRTGPRKDLTEKEKMWFEEVSTLEASILPVAGTAIIPVASGIEPSFARFEETKALTAELMTAMADIGHGHEADDSHDTIQISSELRKQKITQVMKLLSREEALVEGTKIRLERIMLH